MIEYHLQDVDFDFELRSKVLDICERILQDHGFKSDTINIIITSDEFLLSLNEKFLNHTDYTDVLTFDYTEDGTAKLSDIYISLDRVRENAGAFNEAIERELARVMIHGLLHLVGYRDHESHDKNLMRKKEEDYLALIGL
jgi:probable rRNA maturation factor